MAVQTTDTDPSPSAGSAGRQEDQDRVDRSEMPEEALDGDTEGRSRDEKKESDESEEQSNNMTRKKNNDSEVEANHDNVKDLRVKYEVADFEEMKEEDDDNDDDDDDDDDDYSESEDSWFNRVQKKRNEEEKEYVWLRKIDKETYLKVMTPMYLLLEVRAAYPLPVQHVRLAVSHLSRVWPWWGVGVRHRGQERTPWLCVAPTQRPTLQVSGVDDDEDEDELWDSVDQQQWRHTKVAEGMLSSVTLITHPRLSAAAAAVTAAPHAHRNEDKLPGGCSGAGASSTTSVSTTNTTTTPDAAACNEGQVKEVPDLPHKGYLMLGIPRPFVEDTTTEAICRTLITLLDDVLSGKITEEYQPAQESGSHGKNPAEAMKSPSLESWLAEKLQAVGEAKAEGGESNADPESGCQQGEENEHDTRGYVQRTFDSVTSCNFINRCKAERVSYVNGFATCVSAAAAAFLLAAEAGKQGEQGQQQLKTRQRVCEHLHWPAAPLDWHDGDADEEPPPEPSNRPPGVTIIAPNGEDDSVFWEAARYISQQRWGSPAGGKKGTPMHILHGLPGEDSEDDMPLQRYPMVSLRLCDIQKDEGGAPSVQRVGDVVGLGPHSLSPLRHFLITHTVNLHLEERSQVLSFSLHHSTLFLSPGTGRSFADEIETALKNSLRRR